MNILGITNDSGGFHDSSVAWVKDGKVQLALSEERFSRIKHDYSFPQNALAEILRASKMRAEDFHGVAVAWFKYRAWSGFFSRSLWDVPITLVQTFLRKPVRFSRYFWFNWFQKKVIGARSKLEEMGFSRSQIHLISHHLAHASGSFRTSGFEEALSVNLDCFGPDERGNLWSGASYICRGNTISLLENIPSYASLGLFYSTISVCLGFRFGDGEGKTMGLAAYGDQTKAYEPIRCVAPEFYKGKWHGKSSWTDFRLIDDPHLLYSTRWGKYVRQIIRQTSPEDVAAAAQRILEEELTKYFDYLIAMTQIRKIVLGGGIFLNVRFNRMLKERPDVTDVFIHPYPSDGGTAVGAALELYARLSGEAVNYAMETTALGTHFDQLQISAALDSFRDKINFQRLESLPEHVASMIAEGKIVGWFQGPEEWGPRALGHRSVLGDARQIKSRERLNNQLKNRDWFMPFAPSILEEYIHDYFERAFYAPFMTFAFKIKQDKIKLIPAACHFDGTARPNVVRRSVNPLYYDLIEAFRRITGIPLIVNTSFNRHGLPIVHTPENAIEHLLWGCVDALVLGNFLVTRKGAIEPVNEFTEQARRHAYIENYG